jgi:hypothetical protein
MNGNAGTWRGSLFDTEVCGATAPFSPVNRSKPIASIEHGMPMRDSDRHSTPFRILPATSADPIPLPIRESRSFNRQKFDS